MKLWILENIAYNCIVISSTKPDAAVNSLFNNTISNNSPSCSSTLIFGLVARLTLGFIIVFYADTFRYIVRILEHNLLYREVCKRCTSKTSLVGTGQSNYRLGSFQGGAFSFLSLFLTVVFLFLFF
jgi:hypothetical protein